MDKSTKIQKNLFNLYMIIFFILLIIYFPKLTKIEHYFIYVTTAIMSLHFWWGALFLIKNLGPSKRFYDFIIDISTLSFKLGSIYVIKNLPLWLVFNGLLMFGGVIKYNIASKRKQTKSKQKFISKKIFVETLSISSIFILALIVWFLRNEFFERILSIIIFAIQFPLLYWLIFKEKVYKIPSKK